jgi:hypothetical protein
MLSKFISIFAEAQRWETNAIERKKEDGVSGGERILRRRGFGRLAFDITEMGFRTFH